MKKKISLLCLFVSVALFWSGFSFAKNSSNIYHVPPKVVSSIINNSYGQKRAIVLWKSSELESRKVMADYSDIEKAKSGSIISISLDDNYMRLAQFVKNKGPFSYKILLVKSGKGQSLEDVLSKLGVDRIDRYPYVILLSEDNKIQSQGNMFVDFVVDYLFVEGTNKEIKRWDKAAGK